MVDDQEQVSSSDSEDSNWPDQDCYDYPDEESDSSDEETRH